MKRILLIIAVAFTAFSYSQNIFRDNFSTYSAAAQLSGQGTWTNNSSNPGGLGACSGAICTNAKVLATPISYTNYGSSTQSFELKSDTDGCGTPFTASNATDLYVGMVINISNAVSTSPTDFFRVMSGSNNTTAFRVTLQSFGGGFYVGISKGSNSNVFYYSTAINYNTNHLIVLKYTKAAGTTDDIVKLYVDPVVIQGEPTTPEMATATGTDAIGSIDRMCFRQNYFTGLPTGRVGLVSVSGSWSGLAFPNLDSAVFSKNPFTISSNDVNSGILNIKSDLAIEKASLKIYSMQGSLLENKMISLSQNNNDISIAPIQSIGVYIVELITEDNKRFTQKILVK